MGRADRRTLAVNIVQSIASSLHIAPGYDLSRQINLAEDRLAPLVVIDPEDDAECVRLAAVLERWGYVFSGVTPDAFAARRDRSCFAAALREFANPTPPKPDEPTGLGAVVEEVDGKRWVRVWNHLCGGDVWTQGLDIGDGVITREYTNIAAVKVLSEGVRDE